MLEKLKLPRVDTHELLESRRKDLAALRSVNELARRGLESLTRKQADLLAELAKEWSAGAKEAAAHAEHAVINAVAAVEDMAELAATSGQEVMSILGKRYHERLAELRGGIGLEH